MIRVTVHTEVSFETDEKFMAFVASDDVHSVVGFPRELLEARASGGAVEVKTHNPPFAKLATSIIRVEEIVPVKWSNTLEF